MIRQSSFFHTHLRRSFCRGGAVACLAMGLWRSVAVGDGEFCAETFQAERGLPQRAVVALLPARTGYLWIGTYDGLVRFDGERFTVYTSGSTPGLQDSSATALCEDAQGRIWIGHESGGLTRLEGNVFQAVNSGVEPGGSVIGLAVDAQGDVWQASERGGLRRVRDGLAFAVVPGVAGPPNAPLELTADRARNLWVTQDGKAARVVENTLVPWPQTNRPWAVLRLCASREGGLWALTDTGIRRWRDDAWKPGTSAMPWGSGPVSLLRDTATAGLVAGTLSQGLFYRKGDSNWQNLNRTNGLPDDWIRALVEDREGNLWIGTSGGLTVLRPRKVQMHSPPDGWRGKPVMPVLPRGNGEIWAGTEGAGVYRLKDGEWSHFGAEEGLENQFVWTLLEDRRGQLWAGTWRGGIFRLEGERFVRVPELAAITESVTALAESADGALWLGTGMGLARFRDGRLEWFGRDSAPRLPDVRAIALAPDGAVWLGTARHGLARLQNGQVRTFGAAEGMPSRAIITLHFELPDTLWIGTLDQGLIRCRAERFAVVGPTNGLPNATLFHVADDGRGYFWFSSPTGIFRAAKADLNACADGATNAVNFVHYGRSEGLASPTCTGGFQPSGARTLDGRLWFPTARGLAELNPAEVRPNLLPPPVFIEEASLDGEPAALEENQPTPPSLKLVVPPGRHRVQVRYSGLSYSSPERVRFRYQLEGLEGDWVNVGTRRTVFYSFLLPGRYVFRVTAGNNDGIWQEQPAELVILVLPAWWQTWWFQVGVVSGAVAGLSAAVWLTTRARLRRRLELLAREQALERERARIAQDIHDDLGASLTRISMLSESAFDEPPDPRETTRSLAQISATARELTRAMDEIVWAVNPRHDTLDSLVNYLVRFAQDFLSAAGMRCRLDVPLQLPERHLRAELRHNLFLAYKEALHNAVKHARATEVRVSLQVVPGEQDGEWRMENGGEVPSSILHPPSSNPFPHAFRLVVADNGRGFRPQSESAPGGGQPASEPGRIASGNGLANMRHRLEQIGGRCEVDSAPGEGARVSFTVPLRG